MLIMAELVNQGEYINGDFYLKHGWTLCSAPSLRGHIVKAHLAPDGLTSIGIPIYDIEIAEARGFDLDWVVAKALDRLGVTFEADSGFPDRIPLEQYQVALAKTLRVIHDRGLAEVEWEEVDKMMPGASALAADLSRDTTDISFAAYRVQEGF